MIDVTNVHNIDKGDEVIIFGREGVTVDDLAEWLETINYEVSCVIGVSREFIQKTERR